MLRNTEIEDTFVVPFQGELVRCYSLDDAVAVKNANIALDGDWHHFRHVDLAHFADVLARYDYGAAAESLRKTADRVRKATYAAAHFEPLRLLENVHRVSHAKLDSNRNR
jgi:hypothetical protein